MNYKRTKIMSGLHIVRKKLPAGDRYYVYAWRKGPRIHVQNDTYPVITAAILHKQRAAFEKLKDHTEGALFETVISGYRYSPQFTELKPSTQKDYRLWLDRISERFGNTPLAVFNDRKVRGDILQWRDLWRDQPRTADKASVMMATLLGWAVERGQLQINVAARIKQLHKVNKADQIWEDEHWAAFNATNPPKHLSDAMFFAAVTGIRLGDLVTIQWSQVFPTAIKIESTQKRGGRAVIPILPELKAWFEGQERTGTVLKNSRGLAWSASGLGCVFQKQKPQGFDRTIHDLRGSFATRLILAGLTDEQAAMILGWTAKRVSQIRARYVDEERVILHLAQKLSA